MQTGPLALGIVSSSPRVASADGLGFTEVGESALTVTVWGAPQDWSSFTLDT